ncbi:unnamed protein product [Periconia digitata]|uniref:Oxidoreductase acuF-like C2H2 type zinc-finger domain-containing protein n=1 Tax=Periconia digitata TaxID=1303443 RepID=A0A9W4UQT2_9PLEO|nr:unnamed protein product [Periconia digitata]
MTELVSTAHARCFHAFEVLIHALAQPAHNLPDGIQMSDIQNELEKYSIWAGNVGAAHSGERYRLSLDYRLREASFMKEHVLKLLSSLEERLAAGTALLRGNRIPSETQTEETDSEVSTSSDMEGEDGSEDSSWEISSDSNSENDTSSSDRQTRLNSEEPAKAINDLAITSGSISEIQRLVESIKFTVLCLYRLPIRKPAPLDRISNNPLAGSETYQHFDCMYTRDKFPVLDEKIAARLGKMITRRRQILHYRETHKQRLDAPRVQQEISPIPKVSPNPTLAKDFTKFAAEDSASRFASSQATSSHFTKATTVRPGDLPLFNPAKQTEALFTPSIAESKSSMASSYAGKDLRVDVPPRPRDENGQELDFFECPYCLLTKNIGNGRKWKKHVLEDLQPYVCTYGDCDLYDQFFESRNSWFTHEAQYHRAKWFCNVDEHPEYGTETDFLLHMKTDHNQKFDNTQFDLVKNMFRRPTKSLEGTCNLCHRDSKNLRSHIARHLEKIATFAIPRLNETSGSERAERDSGSSRYQEDQRDESDSSESNLSTETAPSDRDSAANDLTETPDIDEDYDKGNDVPDAVGDQTWDDVTDKFSKARKRIYRPLRVLLYRLDEEDKERMILLMHRLRFQLPSIDNQTDFSYFIRELANESKPDVIVVGDVSWMPLDLTLIDIRSVTDAPIIVVSSATRTDSFPDVPIRTKVIELNRHDMEEALGEFCQWEPDPLGWPSSTPIHTLEGLSDPAIVEAVHLKSLEIHQTCEDFWRNMETQRHEIDRLMRKMGNFTDALHDLQFHPSSISSIKSVILGYYQQIQEIAMECDREEVRYIFRESDPQSLQWPLVTEDVDLIMKNLEEQYACLLAGFPPSRDIQPDTSENVILKILQNLDNLDNLFATAVVSRGFYRVFKRNELDLMKRMVWRMSPPAWEYLETCCELDEPRQEYTATSYYGKHTEMVRVFQDAKRLFGETCPPDKLPKNFSDMQRKVSWEYQRFDDALWRIETFCKVFSLRKDGLHIVPMNHMTAQMDWLRGGTLMHQRFFTAKSRHTNDILARNPSCFGKGNVGGLDQKQFEELTAFWDCLVSLLEQHSSYNVEWAASYGIFKGATSGSLIEESVEGDLEWMLNEWYYWLATHGVSTILDITQSCQNRNIFAVAEMKGLHKWDWPALGDTRRGFLKEAVSLGLLELDTPKFKFSGTFRHYEHALRIAIEENREWAVMLLLDLGADFDEEDLQTAVSAGHELIVKLLLKNGVVFSMMKMRGSTLLATAASNNHIGMVKLLLEYGADINVVSAYDRPILAIAVRNHNVELTRLLLDKGADLTYKNVNNWTLLTMAAAGNDEELVRLLLERGADVIADEKVWTSLHAAAFHGNINLVKLLIEKGADILAEDALGKTSLGLAAGGHNPEILKLLLKSGAYQIMENEDSKGWTPFHIAVKAGNVEMARLLYERGVNISLAGPKKRTPLNLAAREANPEMVEFLINCNVDVNVPDQTYGTFLNYLAFRGHTQLLRLAYDKHGGDRNLKDAYGRTPLLLAAVAGAGDTLLHLLETGLDTNVTDEKRDSLISYAACGGIVWVLNRVTSRPDHPNWSPLHWAYRTGQKQFAEALMAEGYRSDERVVLPDGSSWDSVSIGRYHDQNHMFDETESELEIGVKTAAICHSCMLTIYGPRHFCKTCRPTGWTEYCFMCEPFLGHLHPGHEWVLTPRKPPTAILPYTGAIKGV